MSQDKPEMLVPVTDELKSALESAGHVIASLRGSKLNDHNHYKSLKDGLVGLVDAIRKAAATMPLIYTTPPTGACFDMANGSSITNALNECVFYLRNEAQYDEKALSRYEADHSLTVLDHLALMRSLIMDAVAARAVKNMHFIRDLSVSGLVDAASHLEAARHGGPTA